MEVDDAWLEHLKQQIGELPAARRKRYVDELGLTPVDAAILASDRMTGDYFEKALRAGGGSRRTANLLLSHGKRLCNERACALDELGILPERVAEIARLIDDNKIAASSAGAVFDKLIEEDAPAADIAKALGLIQVSDSGAIDSAIDALIASNPQPLQDFRAGKQAAMGALVGMVMKSAKGLNPKLVQERLREKLKS